MSVTTSVGDLHKAPFQSCSERRARADDRVSRGGGGGINADKRHKDGQGYGQIGGKN